MPPIKFKKASGNGDGELLVADRSIPVTDDSGKPTGTKLEVTRKGKNTLVIKPMGGPVDNLAGVVFDGPDTVIGTDPDEVDVVYFWKTIVEFAKKAAPVVGEVLGGGSSTGGAGGAGCGNVTVTVSGGTVESGGVTVNCGGGGGGSG